MKYKADVLTVVGGALVGAGVFSSFHLVPAILITVGVLLMAVGSHFDKNKAVEEAMLFVYPIDDKQTTSNIFRSSKIIDPKPSIS